MFEQESAETLAIQALGWIAAQDDLFPVFLGATGSSEADAKTRAGDPEYLGSVLDFLLMDDAWIVAFCDAVNRPYSDPMAGRAALPGGEAVHWT